MGPLAAPRPAKAGWSRRRKVRATLVAVPAALILGFVGLAAALAISGYEPPTEDTPVAATAAPAPTPVDSDGDGVIDAEDDFPSDAGRSRSTDRDGDGVPNDVDVAPDDPAVSAYPTGVVNRVVDGDTVEVDGFGTIRVIGIDTPERDECGYEEASAAMEALVLGRQVTLVPGARDDRDKYDRLLRYIDVDGADAGRAQIASGLAIARYDSRDGYGGHTREADYVTLDAQTPESVTCAAPAPAPAPVRPPANTPAPAPAPAPAGDPWNMPGPDLDCDDIRQKVRVNPPDYHGLDRDGDGWGCESYG